MALKKPSGSIRETAQEREQETASALRRDGLSWREAEAVARSMAVISTLNPAASSRYQITSSGDRSVFKCVIYTVDYVNVYADAFLPTSSASGAGQVRDEPYLPKKWWINYEGISKQDVIDEIFFYERLSKYKNADDDYFHKFLMDVGEHFGWEKIPIVRTNDNARYDEFFSRFGDTPAFNQAAQQAQELADQGHLVVAATGASEGGGAGHSVVVVPSQGSFSTDVNHVLGKDEGLDGNGIFLFSKSQAGGRNFGRTTVGGTHPFDGQHSFPNFWVYRRNKDKSRGKEAVFI